MLCLHRIVEADAAQNFRRKVGNAGEAQRFAFAQRVADP
jgi:hypothetical protein